MTSVASVCILITASFIGFITIESDVVSADGVWIYVDDDNFMGPWLGTLFSPYNTIQWGVDAADVGDTVFVFSGMYNENVVVNKTINLTGEDRDTTIIKGGGSGDVVLITADWVNITGFTATGGGSDYEGGIGLLNAQNCRIIGNNISFNGWYGMRLKSSNRTTISDNKVMNNELSMYITESSGNIITDNYVSSANWSGIYIISSSNNNTVANNNLISTNHGIHVGTSNNTVFGNTISGTDQGIEIFKSNNTIMNNKISNNRFGIYFVTSSHNNFIMNNNVTNNDYGILLWATSNNTITNNKIMLNNIYGIWSTESSYGNTIISNSIISNGFYGIKLENSSHNRIYHNQFINNNGVGVQAYDNARNNYWNDTYPSGGNYWSDWTTPDTKSGENQDKPGSDGFVDFPYFLDGDALARDYFPFSVPQNISTPTNLTTKVVNNGNNVELEWEPPSSPALNHYLIYRADSATEFDFSVPYNVSKTWPNPLDFIWVDPDPSVTALDDDFYYIVRAANFDGSDISSTSNTAGVWTRTFQSGTSTFSLPLEPFVKEDMEFYCQDMNASYIKWMNTTTHTWMRYDKGSMENITVIEVGEGYEVGLGEQTRYTFCGMPGAMIVYDDSPGFLGFDPDSEAKNLTVSVELDGNVTLTWEEPASMDFGDWYEIYYSNTRDGFFGTPDVHYHPVCPPIGFGTNNITISGLGANDPGARLYFMMVPFNVSEVRGASTYSIGIWTEEYLGQYDTFGIPLKLNYSQTADWYCDNIPNTVGINYYNVSAQRWCWHSKRMGEGAFDPVLMMSEGYQISTSSITKYTFIGV